MVFSQNPCPPPFYLLLLHPPPGRPRSCCGIHCLLLSCSAVSQCSSEEFKGRGCFLSPEPGHSSPRQRPHLPSGLSPAPVLTRQPGEGAILRPYAVFSADCRPRGNYKASLFIGLDCCFALNLPVSLSTTHLPAYPYPPPTPSLSSTVWGGRHRGCGYVWSRSFAAGLRADRATKGKRG